MAAETLDPRRTVYRPDLAAEHLRDHVSAPRYATGRPFQVVRGSIAVRRRPDPALGFETELLFGETFAVYDVADGFAWGQADRDGYVGYVPAEALGEPVHEATHRVTAIGTFVYASADIKSPPLMHLSVNAPLAIVETSDRFCRLAGGGYVISRHIAQKHRTARDFVEIAERLTDVPYLWGGRTRVGVDCSGLVQIGLDAAGIPCPRDSDMQQAELGETVLIPDTLEGLQRGDLVFWRGHVGIMVDGVMLLHANAHHMAVVVEPLSAAVHRIQKSGSEIAAIKRMLPKGR